MGDNIEERLLAGLVLAVGCLIFLGAGMIIAVLFYDGGNFTKSGIILAVIFSFILGFIIGGKKQ
jgi:hypothetical protein